MSQVNFVCRVCNSRVEEKERTFKKSASMKVGCCSLPCFKKTKEYSEKRKEADRIRVEKIRAGGGFVESGTKSSLTRAKRFLEKNQISYYGLGAPEILDLWRREFRDRSGHGEKIKRGRLEKHGSTENLQKADIERTLKASCKILSIEYRSDFSEEEKSLITKKAYQNFRVKDATSWKLTHLLRLSLIEDSENLDPSTIDNLYSEYVSNRFKRASIETDRNGYTNTEKGWYLMTNQADEKFFYRSSWEKRVFEALDHLRGVRKITEVVNPERISYVIDGVKRHYYPDAAYITLSGVKMVLEIKPLKKVEEPVNAAKFDAAKKLLGKNFRVLTEKEIFEQDIINLLESF